MNKKSFSHHRSLDKFENWAKLARENPEQFEKQRRTVIQQFLDSAPEDLRPGLEKIQWRVEQERRRAGNPVGAMIAISKLMWDKLYRLNEKQKELLASQGYPVVPMNVPEKKASVHDFYSAWLAKEIKK